jgi:hypothetical protein
MQPTTLSEERTYWVKTLCRIAEPVLANMSEGRLRSNMPVKYSQIYDGRDRSVIYMEAAGRLIAGIAPWLALKADDSDEGKQRQRLKEQALRSLVHGADPASPDYFNWTKEKQPLVDAAYIAQAFLRAPSALWEPLDPATRQRYITEFKGLRRVGPWYNNWLLFSAIVETFLLSIGESFDPLRIDIAMRKMNEWYVGDGWYSDGPDFHFDYYNGFVIHPMMADIALQLAQKGQLPAPMHASIIRRMQRYGEILERLIAPDGTFPVVGRSVLYRFAVFQPLAQLALNGQLPATLSPGQVRAALTAVLHRLFDAPGVFTHDGWLTMGLAGDQPDAADRYLNSGNIYLTAVGLLPLGLPAGHGFWTAPPEDWTSRRAWSGQPFKGDHALEG